MRPDRNGSPDPSYLVVAALIVLALIAGWILGGGKKVKEEVAYIAAMEEYVYGYPLVMMDVTREVITATSTAGEYSAPINQFSRIRPYVSPEFNQPARSALHKAMCVTRKRKPRHCA